MLERVVLLGLLLSLLAASVVAADLPSAQTSVTDSGVTIRTTVREVRVGFHLASRRGLNVTNLQKNQIALFQDGQPVANVTGLYEDNNLPTRLMLTIDASDSMTKGFAAERDAASAFLRRMVRPSIDQSSIAVFASRTEIDNTMDASSPAMLERIARLHSGGLTALFDAVYKIGESLPARADEQVPSRRVLILLSDGNDTYSLHSLKDAVKAAQSKDVVIYAVTAHDPNKSFAGDTNLEELTSATGGRVYFLKKYEQSERVFAEIEREIRAEYTVTYRPEGDTCGYHQLRIEPSDRTMQVRARGGFFGQCL